ncbi:MAG: hypothetical protein JWM81_775 [Candidatus Saccharibacteria bacterium]|nr:hypothetical protein [Candidatus Saccharibacteria bacterium]
MPLNTAHEFRHIIVAQPEAVALLDQATATAPAGAVEYDPNLQSEFSGIAHLLDASGLHPVAYGLDELVPLAKEARNLGGKLISLADQSKIEPCQQTIPRIQALLAGQPLEDRPQVIDSTKKSA